MAKLIGTAPNQVPTNGDLGSMAFEDRNNYVTKTNPIYQPYRNLIINGDMSIAQRGTSESGIGVTGYYTCDRWRLGGGNFGNFDISQSTDTPTGQGFSNSLKLDCSVANTSLTSSASLLIMQRLEGQNLQHLKYGTSSAESLTLSFWVKSNKTGTYIIELDQDGNSKDYSQLYTINSASTWEKKTFTFNGDTASSLINDNSEELEVNFWLVAGSDYTSGTLNTSWESTTNANRAVGQVNLADNTSNEWYITGVQLEVGTSASDFEFLPYDVNFQRCQRYYETSYDAVVAGTSGANGTRRFNGCTDAGSNMVWGEKFAVTKRATPTQTFYRDDQTNTTGWVAERSGSSITAAANNWNNSIHQISAYFTFGSAHNFANGYVQGHWVADSEL